ncbi:MAG: M14 family metallopeptidase, partial [Planctomycetota bacterium]
MIRRILLVALGLAGAAPGQQEEGYQPMGAPVDPRVEARWNRYHDYAEATRLLKALAQAHPRRCRLQSLGRSYGGREMWLLTVANLDAGGVDQRPAFWIDGGIHANEVQGVEVVLYTAWFLLESDGRNEFVSRLLRERTFYLLPMLSPDSRDAHMHEPHTTHSPRGGQRPVDDDRDGRVDEDGPDDLDGDGHITRMRVQDPNGRFKTHPDYPELLVPVEEGEPGQYTLLGPEGVDNDGDGRVNEDGEGYYDPNRDWAWQWQPRSVQRGAYRYPFSILENRMAADFILAHPNIAGAQSYHNAGGMILRGPGTPTGRYEPADVRVYDAIARKGEMMLPGYRYLNVAKELYTVYGGELDWIYAMRGAIAYTNELFTPFNLFRERRSDGGSRDRAEDRHKFNKYLLLNEGWVAWHEVDHPQYGRIEVGGFKKSWRRQPPSFLLEEECHRNMAFTLYHADQMPQVAIQSVAVEPLEGGLARVTAVIRNRRLIPTRLAVDVERRITPPDVVSIGGRDLEVLVGLKSDGRFFRHPEEQKRRPAA